MATLPIYHSHLAPSVYLKISLSIQEYELLDLLSQYEDEERGGVGFLPVASSITYQPLSIECSSMDAVYKAMASRVAEEEQTQRTMIALNEMKPAYPGKSNKELQSILDQVSTGVHTSLHHCDHLDSICLATCW